MSFRDLTPSLLLCVCTCTRVRRPDANFRSSSSASQPCVFETGALMGLELVIGWLDSKPWDSSVSAFSVLGLHVRVPTPSFYLFIFLVA